MAKRELISCPHEEESSGVESGSVASVTEGEEPSRRNGRELPVQHCKFTVNVRQQSGRQLHVSEITFTRFTTLPHFPDLDVDLYVTAGGMKKV
jgi:hypothetical protein